MKGYCQWLGFLKCQYWQNTKTRLMTLNIYIQIENDHLLDEGDVTIKCYYMHIYNNAKFKKLDMQVGRFQR